MAIIVASWNHFETTTRPCLEALRRFTDVPYHLICVDNDSDDGTRAALRALAQEDPRVEVVFADRNLGWADGSLAGLRRVRADDTHVVLLNSDTLVSPGWLSKLLWHIGHQPRPAVVIPREDARPEETAFAATASTAAPPRRAIEPGTGAAPLPLELPGVLELAAAIERSNHRQSREAPPSGFCLLFHVADRPMVENYLADFGRYHSGELDWQAWWGRQRMACRLALDCYVFHGRGGSGGYYAYDRAVRGDVG